MAPARNKMKSLFENHQASQPEVPYVPNFTARISQEPSAVLDLLIEQIDHPVLWTQTLQAILAHSPKSEWIEVGPGQVLQGLLKRSCKSWSIDPPHIQSVSDLETFQQWSQSL